MKILMFFLCIGLLSACKKSGEAPYQSRGVLIGYDPRECPATFCGGLQITIKNDTTKNPFPVYNINASLQQLGISERTKFPVNVLLNWRRDTGIFAATNLILVSKIMVVK
jgi:hypothetical protein